MLSKLKGAVQGWMASQQANSQSRDNIRGYSDSLGRMLLDMRLEPHELDALAAQQRGLGLDWQAVLQVHRGAFAHMSQQVLCDGIVTAEELEALATVGTALKVEWSDLPPHHLHTYQTAHTCMEIQAGRLPCLEPHLTVIKEASGEVVHAEIAAQILDERVVSRQYVGGSSGMSVRLCKGVSYRFGSSRGRSIPVTAVVPVDQGVFSISNQRVAFIGQRKSFSVEWRKVLSVDPLSDGVHLAFQSRSKSALIQYRDSSRAEILSALLGYYLC